MASFHSKLTPEEWARASTTGNAGRLNDTLINHWINYKVTTLDLNHMALVYTYGVLPSYIDNDPNRNRVNPIIFGTVFYQEHWSALAINLRTGHLIHLNSIQPTNKGRREAIVARANQVLARAEWDGVAKRVFKEEDIIEQVG